MANDKLTALRAELAKAANPERAKASAWFFKTGKGQYGEGDRFIGVTVPALRKIANRHLHLGPGEVKTLLESKIHEHRFAALEILVAQFETGTAERREAIYRFY